MISKVFKAYDVRALYPEPLSEPVARKIGFAAGQYLASLRSADQVSNPKMNQVVVGRDMRPHSPSLAAALIEGLRASGIDVLDLGMVDTSFIYYAINHLGCLGGIQTTASHNPVDYNGFKFSGPHATPIGAETGLNAIRDIAAALGDEPMAPKGKLEPCDLWDGYKTHVMQFLKLDRPLKVAVDASNGMAGVFMPRLFDGVPKLEIIAMNYQIGKGFAHDPNPLVPENMVPAQTAVREQHCDLGVCFDGDADRCMLTDEQGTIIGCDLLGALFGQYFLKQSPGAVVAYDLRSSRGLPESVAKSGGKPMRGRVGHVNMKKLMRENDGVFGAELSGHMYYKDNFYTDSGVMTFALAMTILSASKQP